MTQHPRFEKSALNRLNSSQHLEICMGHFQEGVLLLEDGTIYKVEPFGAKTHKVGEVVFNTMSGYQEALTDPSYAEQILVMTYPHIGNTGVNPEDIESDRLWVHGFVAKRFQDTPSNHRSTQSLEEYLNNKSDPFITWD